jgi:catechol 2,3-dioxygenase-like lactoylglutathione lyase family enzyme
MAHYFQQRISLKAALRPMLSLLFAMMTDAPITALAQEKTPTKEYLRGFHEVVVSVRNLPAAMKFYQDVAGWEIAHFADATPEQARLWGLKESVRIEECLLRNKGDKHGWLRLIKFHVPDSLQRHIRSNAHAWDVGGIYDVNVRVKDMQAKLLQMDYAGWQASSDPHRYMFGKMDVEESVLRGPDGVVIALIQRHAPPLEGFRNLREFSYIFNSTQIVGNMETALDFYMNKLGFKIYMKSDNAANKEEENVFGLPHNINKTVKRSVVVLHPQGTNDGSVELLHFEGLKGKNCAASAVPPNLGIFLLRFPVNDIEGYRKRILAKGIRLERDLAEFECAPYGNVKMMAVRSPDGAVLEFFEAKGMTTE